MGLAIRWTVFLVIGAFTVEAIGFRWFSEEPKIPPPSRFAFPMRTQYTQINNAGPPTPYARAKAALGLPEIALIGDPALDDIMDDIKEGLRYALQTENEFTFPIHGTATTGMVAVLDNLIEDGDKVLVLSKGHWGDTMANVSARLGADLIHYKRPIGTRYRLEEIELALRIHRPRILCMVMGETVNGVKQPMEGVGELARIYGALLVVDVVTVVGIQPVDMDRLKIDAVYANANKGFGAVPGLAPVSLGPRAVEKVTSRKAPPKGYQTDLVTEGKMWKWNVTEREMVHTLSFPLIYALREGIAHLVEEGLENSFERHAKATQQLSDGLEEMGLEHFVQEPNDRLVGVTTVRYPRGKDPFKISEFMLKNSNISVSPGYGPVKGMFLMIATFGTNADPQKVSNLLEGLRMAIESPETNS